MAAKPEKSKEEQERQALEAQLMGGEVAEEATEEVPEPISLDETPAPPEEDLETVKSRLAKIEEERKNLEFAVNEQREARKQAERTMATLLDRIEQAKLEREAAQKPPEEVIPSMEDDPAGHLAYLQRQTVAEIQALKAERAQERQMTQAERQQQEFLMYSQRAIDEYAAKIPDYNDAAQFLMQDRDAELRDLGVSDPQQRQATIIKDSLQIKALALQQGRNPGEVFYNLAKRRGFQGGQQTQQGNVQGQQRQTVQPKSLSAIGGRAPGSTESLQARAERILNTTRLEDIMDIDDKEFDKVLRSIK